VILPRGGGLNGYGFIWPLLALVTVECSRNLLVREASL
jgi:hypothetical protein